MTAVGAIMWMKTMTVGGAALGPYVFGTGMLGVLYTMAAWWTDVVREAQSGDHTRVVQMSPSLWHDPVHRLRGDVLRGLVLGLLRYRALPQRRQ